MKAIHDAGETSAEAEIIDLKPAPQRRSRVLFKASVALAALIVAGGLLIPRPALEDGLNRAAEALKDLAQRLPRLDLMAYVAPALAPNQPAPAGTPGNALTQQDLATLELRHGELDARVSELATTARTAGDAANAAAAAAGALRQELDTELKPALTALRAELTALQQKTTDTDAIAAIKALNQEVEKAVSGQNSEIASLSGRIEGMQQAAETERKSAFARERARTLMLGLLATSQTVSSNEIDELAAMVPPGVDLSAQVASLKALAGSELLSSEVLRERYAALRPMALRAAREEYKSLLSGSWLYLRQSLGGWGILSTPEENGSEMAIAKAGEELDRGNIDGAIFELEGASPDVREALKGWMDAARLRVSFDKSARDLLLALATTAPATGGENANP